ncbi:MAG: protein translocase subunit SecD [Candidatus Hydrogenedentes bacterium]|nr:protein translocase subunit SecD [Candidatus Hydrogenedentota bacterium]
MTRSLTRTILIWAALIMALVYIVPTVGWMTLSDGARAERLARWEEEDTKIAAEQPGEFSRLLHRITRWSEFDREMVINLGLDLQGGIHMVLGFNVDDLGPEKLAELEASGMTRAQIEEQIQDTVHQQIERRINDFEADEPIIQTLGTNQVQIQLPGEKDIDRARKLITKAAVLNFHIVAGPEEMSSLFAKIRDAYPGRFVEFLNSSAIRGGGITVSQENYDRVDKVLKEASAKGGLIPDNKTVLFSKPPKPWEPQVYELFVVDKEPIQSGEGLTKAAAIPDNTNPPYWQILFEFNNAAGENFGKVTQANTGNPMAIVLDGVVVSAPRINSRITTNGSITGSFEGEEARDLSIALNSGSMVVPVREDYTGVVGATLGAESVERGIYSSLAGIIIVAVCMLGYYLYAGAISVVALVMNAIMIVAAMAYFDMTLTLPGIAGLILTIGMAVDGNVLIFERIREELKLGHSLMSSIEAGFVHATSSIVDANVTTLIAAIVLLQFGTGPIEGFAIALSIGIVTSVFTALVASRAMFDFLTHKKLMTKLTMMSLIKETTHFKFMSAWKIAATISIIGMIASVALCVLRYEQGTMFGVDFTEGTNAQITLTAAADVPADAVRIALQDAKFDSPSVQKAGAGESLAENHFIIRVSETDETLKAKETPQPDGSFLTVSELLQHALAPLTTGGAPAEVALDEVMTVGPAVGEQLRWDALQAVIASLFFIVLYVAFRFEMKFAAGAVLGLVHDVILTLGVLALLDRPITMAVVAAILTVIGYSLNDTIVVFDRIREDQQLFKGKGLKLVTILDDAVNKTLSRTILTGMTTLFVVTVLYFFGGAAIQDFALALIVGILAGTYSSIYVASPLVYVWSEYFSRHVVEEAPVNTRRRKKSAKTKDVTSEATS